MLNFDHLSQHDIQKCLKEHSDTTYDLPPEVLPSKPSEAAVLAPLLRKNNSWHILFIRRAEIEGDHHSGQVALAGGKREANDVSLEMTSLREAEEEIGIKTSDATVLGQLNNHHTISHFQITPFVAYIDWPYPLVLEKREVARVFTIPLNWLADSTNFRTEYRQHKPSNNPWPVIYYNKYEGEVLWGATARITLSFIELLKKVI